MDDGEETTVSNNCSVRIEGSVVCGNCDTFPVVSVVFATGLSVVSGPRGVDMLVDDVNIVVVVRDDEGVMELFVEVQEGVFTLLFQLVGKWRL